MRAGSLFLSGIGFADLRRSALALFKLVENVSPSPRHNLWTDDQRLREPTGLAPVVESERVYSQKFRELRFAD